MTKDELGDLIHLKSIDALTNQDALNLLGLLIDDASDRKDEVGIERAFSWSDELKNREMKGIEKDRYHYRLANAWAARRHILLDDTNQWDWHYPELLKELFYLRLAIKSKSFAELEGIEKCQIYVNAANTLNTLGRFVDALDVWNRAIEIIPSFAMAHGNIGLGLMSYARCLYDEGHAKILMKFAYDRFSFASSRDGFYESDGYDIVRDGMAVEADNIASHIDLETVTASINLNDHSLGQSAEEKEYRKWCLNHCLFLNPLNDLGFYPIAACDVFGLPSITVKIGEAPSLVGFFNQLKQEYASARYMYYEGTLSENVHFSDRGVMLYNTLDYPVYSLASERVKASFRLSYSIFDKIAYFINAYWKLGMKENKINFRSVWMEQKADERWGLRSIFEDYENLPMRGLYWLSKDILNNDVTLKDTTEPDAEALNNLRNHLEHKYFKVHDILWQPERDNSEYFTHLKDQLSFSIKQSEFEEKTLRLLKMVRAGLIYLSLAVHREEIIRRQNNGVAKALPVELQTFSDAWKR
jgi:hypothetical protein